MSWTDGYDADPQPHILEVSSCFTLQASLLRQKTVVILLPYVAPLILKFRCSFDLHAQGGTTVAMSGCITAA